MLLTAFSGRLVVTFDVVINITAFSGRLVVTFDVVINIMSLNAI